MRGIVQKKAGRGIESLGKRRGKTESPYNYAVNSAEKNSRLLLPTAIRGSAPITASRSGGGFKGLMTNSALALSAEKNSRVTSMHESNAVPVFVLGVVELPGERPVYNLEIEEAHEFFANGVLVHNCIDSLRYILSYLTGSGEETQDEVVDYSVQIGPRL